MRPIHVLSLMSVTLALALGCASRDSQSGGAMTSATPTATAPAVTAPTAHPACQDRRVWGSYLRGDSAATIDEIFGALEAAGLALTPDQKTAVHKNLKPVIKWRLIRYLLVEGQNHNFGAVDLPAVSRADGSPLRLFRSGFTTTPDQPGSCFRSLLEDGDVRHVINLYSGVMPTQDLESAERSAAQAANASYFTTRDAPPAQSSWRYELEEHGDDPKVVRAAMESVAKLLNEQILLPGGAAPKGNVHLHCGGGMHRTGMLVGILERCFNKRPMSEITADYKHHVDWRSDQSPGGFEAGNLSFIEAFDCSLLHGAPTQ